MDNDSIATAVMDLLDKLDPNGESPVTHAINKALAEWGVGQLPQA